VLLVASAARAEVFALGSSYSWDGRPAALDGAPQWHIDCGKSLLYIFENPDFPCVANSTNWPTAFGESSFDYISFQPVDDVGITQQSDIDTISLWMWLQRDAVVVLHPTWPIPFFWEEEFHASGDGHVLVNRTGSYHWNLAAKLAIAHPDRVIISDRVNEMLDTIYHHIEIGIGPLDDFRDMFRDFSGHASQDYGQYLLHNALRQAFGQETGVDSSDLGVEDPAVREYLDLVVQFHPAPEPGAPSLLAPGLLLLLVLEWRKRRARGAGAGRLRRAGRRHRGCLSRRQPAGHPHRRRAH
jgi:hypothetical protein